MDVNKLASILSKLLSDQHECEIVITFNKRGGDENDKTVQTSVGCTGVN